MNLVSVSLGTKVETLTSECDLFSALFLPVQCLSNIISSYQFLSHSLLSHSLLSLLFSLIHSLLSLFFLSFSSLFPLSFFSLSSVTLILFAVSLLSLSFFPNTLVKKLLSYRTILLFLLPQEVSQVSNCCSSTNGKSAWRQFDLVQFCYTASWYVDVSSAFL